MSASLFTRLWDRLCGSPMERDPRRYRSTLARIAAIPHGGTSDDQLHQLAASLRARAQCGEPTNDLLVEVFALAREVAWRVLGQRPYDEQVLAAIALHQGRVVELQTGEGKTLAAVLPAALNALAGQGVHVLTFNDYLAQRDAQWMGEIYNFLGLQVGYVRQGMGRSERLAAYAADVTYATAKEAGFDYLRDQLATDPSQPVQRPFQYAIVDEADSILIDEARIPLVLAGSDQSAVLDPRFLTPLAESLVPGEHFATDEEQRNIFLTDAGLDFAERALDRGSLYDSENTGLLAALNVALHARVLLRRDVDYIVRDGRVELVDAFTGRVATARRWPDGLQGALEAREGLVPRDEGRILASISLQHFLGLYPRLAGMTGTAQPAAAEFFEFYRLKTTVIPTHRPLVRVHAPALIFTHKAAKKKALLQELQAVHGTGRPVLVGTASIVESEGLAAALEARGLACQVLNARNDEKEAEIVAQAGALGAITISTNMAGRGTDIPLGGADGRQHEQVAALGGLYVIGTNLHESRRIDDQLRGRAGRQGDPGSTRFFVSLQDDLIARHGVMALIPPHRRPQPQDGPVEDPVVRREVERAQRVVEGQDFEIRRTLWRYSSLVEAQRKALRLQRDAALQGKTPLNILQQRDPEAYEDLCAQHGEVSVQQAERQLFLFHADRLWSAHLAHIADIREGIHLHSLGGGNPFSPNRNPQEVFHGLVAEAFAAMQEELEDVVADGLLTLDLSAGGVDLARQGLKRPAATWTYLINDAPFGGMGERFIKGVLERVAGRASDGAPLRGPDSGHEVRP